MIPMLMGKQQILNTRKFSLARLQLFPLPFGKIAEAMSVFIINPVD
jgi:hypothetical protein